MHASIEMYGGCFDHCHSGKDAHDKEKEFYDEEDHKVYSSSEFQCFHRHVWNLILKMRVFQDIYAS